MKERGRELSQAKTVVTCGDHGFDVLGHHGRTYNGTDIAKPSRKTVHAFVEKVRSIVKANKQAKVENLIGLLHPVLRGWATSHRHDARKETFGSVEAAIFKVLWPWARSRHPTKTTSWVKDTYFHTQGDRRGVFSGKDSAEKGKPRPVWLFSASKMPIKRPRKMKAGAHPYDPAWEVYCEQRLGVKMETHLAGKRQRSISGRNRGHLSRLHPTDHRERAMAQASPHLAHERREGQRGQSCPPPPQRSQAGASPRFDRGETVSRKGQPRGLSRVTGNGHARFLGGRAAATPLSYPATPRTPG